VGTRFYLPKPLAVRQGGGKMELLRFLRGRGFCFYGFIVGIQRPLLRSLRSRKPYSLHNFVSSELSHRFDVAVDARHISRTTFVFYFLGSPKVPVFGGTIREVPIGCLCSCKHIPQVGILGNGFVDYINWINHILFSKNADPFWPGGFYLPPILIISYGFWRTFENGAENRIFRLLLTRVPCFFKAEIFDRKNNLGQSLKKFVFKKASETKTLLIKRYRKSVDSPFANEVEAPLFWYTIFAHHKEKIAGVE